MKGLFRSVVLLLVLTLLSGVVTVMGQDGEKPLWGWATVADYEADSGQTLPAFSEAPMLAEQVSAGTLPPVAERLPKEPLVDNPFESVGKYGGRLTLGQVSAGIGYPASNFTTFESLFSLARDGATIVPNIAKGWEFNEDGTSFTIFLREGHRWSDGDPFDADDIMFFWNDIILNTDITPNVPSRFSPGGEPMQVEKVDQYTVRFTFAVPYYAILPNLASVVFTGCQGDIFEAEHFMKQFHIKYNDKAEEDAKAAGFETWVQLFNAKRYYWWASRPDVPTMGPWRVKEMVPEGTVLERNPYYYKVDTAGQQLPYIDTVVATIFNDAGTLALKMVAGEYDYQDWSTSVADYPALVDGAEQGNYEVFMAPSLWTSIAAYSVNQQYVGDEAVAEILRDVRFRQALSYAIDRNEINDVVALGQGTPFQATIHPSASFYKEEWGNAYIEYNPDLANQLLDEMGMTERDGENFRLRPDGQPFSLIISDVNDAIPEKMSELIKEYWDAVGIRTIVTATDRTLMGQQFTSGEYMVAGWAMDGAAESAVSIGVNGYLQGWQWAPEWNAWYTSRGAEGEEPPENVKRMFELYRNVPIMSVEEQRAALTEIFDIWEEGLWRIGTIGMVPKPGMYRKGLHNVDTNTYTDNADVGIGTFNRHYQFYWDTPQ
ncbi:MAG: ABC transporter substrate-binding protein [Chloroflexi bacterium]|nr:ABC transporter substrate-binding protein [Chloroflexota bacterium]